MTEWNRPLGPVSIYQFVLMGCGGLVLGLIGGAWLAYIELVGRWSWLLAGFFVVVWIAFQVLVRRSKSPEGCSKCITNGPDSDTDSMHRNEHQQKGV